jgi:Recombination endonuclease VII
MSIKQVIKDVGFVSAVSYSDAKRKGQNIYFTGIPCARGHIAPRYISGRVCAECAKDRAREWARKNTDKTHAAGRRYRAANRATLKERQRLWRLANPERHRQFQRNYLKRNYSRHLAYMRKRKGLPEATRPCPARCELCGDTPGTKSLALDHCHKTGKFRGWICGRCNRALGFFKDCPKRLALAIIYLARHSSVRIDLVEIVAELKQVVCVKG